MKALHLATCLVLLLAAQPAAAEYGYPIKDRYAATVLGTPAELRWPVPPGRTAELRSVELFGDREVPGVFWQHDSLRYSVARQEGEAPLIFLVAGTGALFDSGKMRDLQKVFHQAGFHVINVSSPTHVEFIVNGSKHSVPGRMEADVHDLYAAMEAIWQDLREDVLATEFHLAGYSLGASQSAFLAELDSRHQRFRFKRVLMLNPSVDLFTSVNNLDEMVRESAPGGAEDLKRVFHDLFSRVAHYFATHGRGDIDNDLLFQVARSSKVSDEELKTLIGVSFRMSSANMLFATDVMTGGHHLVEPDQRLGVTTPLLSYMKMAARWTWTQYLDEVLLPFWRESQPDLTREELIASGSLHAIEKFLRGADHVGVMHNRDDIILGPGDIAWLEGTFGDRARIYPRGGHCGNLMYRENVENMLRFFGVEPTP
jgi:hypothetical protein